MRTGLRRAIRWTLALLMVPVVLGLAGWLWLTGIDFSHGGANPAAQRSDLAWLEAATPAPRGRILAVVSSARDLLDGQPDGGYELTELSRAHWVFEAAGYAVDLASPVGGAPPKVIDDGLEDADYAYLNDPATRAAMAATLPLADIDPARYDAVWVVGGKGAMIDLYRNPDLARIIAAVYRDGGVIAAVCHGPAGLLDIEIEPGRTLLAGRRVTGFSNAEELLLMDDPVGRLGFMLQDALGAEGEFSEGPMYLEHIVEDGRVLTGQNPWSTWALAEATVRALGAEPAHRPRGADERAVELVLLYESQGYDAARAAKPGLAPVDNGMVLMYGVVAAMRWEVRRAAALARLARG
jgi:putative intracellular protease/amidase